MFENILLWISTLLLCVLAYDFVNKNNRIWRLLSKLPGEPVWPLVGNAFQLGTTPDGVHRNLRRIWEKHGRKTFRLMLGFEPMLVICEPDDARKILSSSTEIEKSELQTHCVREFLGDSLVQSSAEKWRPMRKLLTPMFHARALEQYLETANSEGNILVEKIRPHAGGPSFDIHSYLLAYGLDVICGTTLGIKLNAQNGCEQEYVKASRKRFQDSAHKYPKVLHTYRYDFLYNMSPLSRESAETCKTITESLDRIIEFRRQQFEKNVIPKIRSEDDILEYISDNRKDLTFIDIMLLTKMPDGTAMPQESIREETNLLVFAGFDTTLSTMCWALYNLAKYPKLQQIAYEEQLAIFGDDLTREATMQDLGEMKYLQRFVKESMRLYPTVGQFGRKLKSDLELDGGRLIAAGTEVMFYVPGLHSNPDYFPDPHRFDPDRFLQPISQYLYLPFSAGIRNCIGQNYAWMEIRAALSKILRHFELSHAGEHDEPSPVHEGILISRTGFKLQLKERKRN